MGQGERGEAQMLPRCFLIAKFLNYLNLETLMFNLKESFGTFELVMRCGAIAAVATAMAATHLVLCCGMSCSGTSVINCGSLKISSCSNSAT
jgi:hypothetical protein